MFKLFRVEDKTNQPIQLLPEWNYIKANMEYNITRVQNYYRNSTVIVPSDHFLVRLLQSIPINKNLDIDTYYRQVSNIALGHSMAMQMTSSYYRGRFFTGVFYGKKSMECLLAVDDSFNYNTAHADWKNIVAVKPLMHDKSDFKLLLPDGVDYSDERSTSVVMINIPMLAIQYRAFYLSNMVNSQNNRQKSTMNFVAQYVIPNMLRDHVDLCLINKHINRFNKTERNINFLKKHSYALINIDYQLDRAVDKVLQYIQTSPMRFDSILKTIPSFSKQNAYKALLMPDITPNKQVHWATMLARLKYIAFLFDIAGSEASRVNQSEINEIVTELNYGDIYNVFKTNLPSEIFFKVQDYLDTIANSLANNNAFKH